MNLQLPHETWMEKIKTNNCLKTKGLISNKKCNQGNGQKEKEKEKKKKKVTNPAKISKMQSMCIHTSTSYSSCSQWRGQWLGKKRGTSQWSGYRSNAAHQLWQEALWVTPSTTPEQSALLSIPASSWQVIPSQRHNHLILKAPTVLPSQCFLWPPVWC